MDSLSQFVLGAAVAGAVVGPRAGAKALLWGGVVATLPDLDVFVPLGDPVSDFTYHRSASHSVFVLTLATPLLAWLILRLHPGERPNRATWLWAVWLVLITHVLLDCFTVYGTQIFWPVSDYPVAWGSVFIIDPLYTLPLLVAALAGLWLRRRPERLRRWCVAALAISTAYLGAGSAAKLHVDGVVRAALARDGRPDAPFVATPTALNAVLWRVVVMVEGGYLEGFHSLSDPRESLRFARYDSDPGLLAPIGDAWAVRRLQWFTKGFVRTRLEEGGLVTMTDLRMGVEPSYVFSFVVGERHSEIVAVPPRRYDLPDFGPGSLGTIWRRIVEGPGTSGAP